MYFAFPLCGFENFFLGSGIIKDYVQSGRYLFSSLYFSEPLYFLQSKIIFKILLCLIHSVKGFPGGSGVKNLPAVEETLVRSLGREDPLEKEMATHSSILA